MTEHPAKGCTPAQITAFEWIAISVDIGFSPKPIAALLKKGLIEKLRDRHVGRDRFGPVIIPQYVVPLHLHRQWCDWCSEQPDLVEKAQ